MDLYDRFRQARSQVREANKKKIQGALNNIMPKTASLVFDLSQGEKGKKIDNNRRAHVKAVELVSSLLNSFSLPVRPMLSYRGMVKNAIDNTGVIEDGIIDKNRTFDIDFLKNMLSLGRLENGRINLS